MKEYTKKSDYEMEVTDTKEVISTTVETLDTLKYNEEHIMAEIVKFNERKEEELAELRVKINEATKLGLKSKKEEDAIAADAIINP